MSANVGFPQLNPASYPSQVFWLAVAFTLLYVIMAKFALPRVAEVIDDRRERREKDLSQAEEMNSKAGQLRSEYEKFLAKAQQEAATFSSEADKALHEKITAIEARFVEDSRKRITEAEEKIAKARVEALHFLSDIAADAAIGMVKQVAGITVDKEAAKKAVSSAMQEAA